MKAGQVAELLAGQAETVAAMLLPNGKRVGQHWCVGSVSGESGESLKVALSGSKAGRWVDYANDSDHGDLIDLWAVTHSLSIREAIIESKDYLGIDDPIRARPAAKRKTVPATPAKNVSRLDITGEVNKYLAIERKICPTVISAYKIAELRDSKHGAVVVFPYLKDEKRVMIKYMPVGRDGKKHLWTSKDSAKILFGWQTLPDRARSVVITEGEIDAMSLATVGIPALSIPYGAGKQSQNEWIENDYDDLEQFDEIIVWMDNDEPGRESAIEIATRLGIERCRIASASHESKDINEMLLKGCKLVHFQECIDSARAIEPDNLRSAADFCDEVINEFYPPDGEEVGVRLGWDSANWLLIRPAELIIVSGTNGHGKSQFAGQLILYAMNQGHKAVIASMELPSRRLLHRLTKQVAAIETPSEEYIRAVHRWYRDKLWIYDKTGKVSVDKMLEAFTYSRRRYGADFFLIDSLMMCGIGADDYAGQKEFVNRLTEWKLENNATVLLVTHSRKQQSESMKPDKMDVRGAAEITDMADTVLTVWRNKDEDKPDGSADGLIICSKQRNSGYEGKIPAWFDQPSGQFLPFGKARPWRFVNYEKERAQA